MNRGDLPGQLSRSQLAGKGAYDTLGRVLWKFPSCPAKCQLHVSALSSNPEYLSYNQHLSPGVHQPLAFGCAQGSWNWVVSGTYCSSLLLEKLLHLALSS